MSIKKIVWWYPSINGRQCLVQGLSFEEALFMYRNGYTLKPLGYYSKRANNVLLPS